MPVMRVRASILADAGSVALVGSADLQEPRKVVSETGTADVIGVSASLSIGRVQSYAIACRPGFFLFSGEDAGIDKDTRYIIDADDGVFQVFGYSIRKRTIREKLEAGTVDVSGYPINDAEQGLVSVAGLRVLFKIPFSASVTSIRGSTIWVAQGESLNIQGSSAVLRRQR